MNAWPSLETILYDGWALRFAAGYTRRANSVHPLYPSMDDDEEKARLCLRLYRDRGLPAVFKLTPAATIDGLLGRLGYVTEADSLVLMKDLGELPPPSRTDIELLPQVTERVGCGLLHAGALRSTTFLNDHADDEPACHVGGFPCPS